MTPLGEAIEMAETLRDLCYLNITPEFYREGKWIAEPSENDLNLEEVFKNEV